jgi:ABC-type branched-subunit amino acid transport system ATPase component
MPADAVPHFIEDGEKVSAIIAINNLRKTYPGVTALDDFSCDFSEGEVHALIGENGAGKSTLIKCIAGAITPRQRNNFSREYGILRNGLGACEITRH